MQLTLTQNNRTYHVELESATCLAIPYDYDGEQPNFFNVPKGAASPYESDDFVGCVNGNKGCEVMVINQNIHCTGTHTECAGHIQNENIFINDVLTPGYILTELISVNPIDWVDTAESYHCPVAPDEKVITRRLIKDFVSQPVPGLVIRTLPNTPEKLDRKYDESN
ncbi:MAG: hypothetical protein U9N31_02490, partial [Candidatus Marinimicrobia bacterium]|nr:hypothetical protein [Candidatus Neomarinimicrobiota bacterium]